MNFVEVHMEGTGEAARLVGPADWSIPIPVRYREAATPKAGKTLVAGFRPEHLEIGESGSGVASFQARAEVVEYLGNEELLHLNAADQDVVGIVDSSHNVRPGDILTMRPPARQASPVRRRERPDAGARRRGGGRLNGDPPGRRLRRPRRDPSGADLVERVVASEVLHRGDT